MTNKQPRLRNQRYVYRPSRKARLVNRRVLVEYLLDELQTGNGITGLYAGLLIKTILAEEPDLQRAYPRLAGEPDHQREPSIPRVRSRRAPC